MTTQPTPVRALTRALTRAVAAVVAGVVAGGLLVAAALAGRAAAGPPSAPAVLPPPQCPAVLAEALPVAWPSSTFLVPWGPVSGRVCGYPGAAVAEPDVARLAASSSLDPTAVAELAGLVEDLAAPVARCTLPERAGAGGRPRRSVSPSSSCGTGPERRRRSARNCGSSSGGPDRARRRPTGCGPCRWTRRRSTGSCGSHRLCARCSWPADACRRGRAGRPSSRARGPLVSN